MSESVRVVVRFRPINDIERAAQTQGDVIDVRPSEGLVLMKDSDPHRRFVFDNVFDGAISQPEVYRIVGEPMMTQFLKGYNCTIFAYGQTGSGKSFSTFGRKQPNASWSASPLKGIVPRALEQVFATIEKLNDVATVQMKVSFLELYMEMIRDLLKEGNTSLKIREPPDGEVYVQGLSETFVLSADEAMKILETGEAHRMTAATRMNDTSSRSHCVFTLSLQQQKTDGSKLVSKMHFVDLAGSEAVKKTQAEGVRLEEAKAINLSLTTLAKVIHALTDSKPQHPPFRDSQLTRLLRPALGGNSKTTVIVTCSPHQYNYYETLSSLRFAERAKKIHLHGKVNVELTREQLRALVDSLRLELERMTWMYQTLKETGVDPNASEFSRPDGTADPNTATAATGEDNNELTLELPLPATVSALTETYNVQSQDKEGSDSSHSSDSESDDRVNNNSLSLPQLSQQLSQANGVMSLPKRTSAEGRAQAFSVTQVASLIKTIKEKDEEILRLRDELSEREQELSGVTSSTVNELKRQLDDTKSSANQSTATAAAAAAATAMKKEVCEAGLAAIPLFRKLLESEREEISKLMRQEHFKRGQVVCRPSEQAKLIIVDHGELDIVKKDKAVRRLRSGDFFGELALVVSVHSQSDTELLAATAVASVWTIDRTTFALKMGPTINVLRRECGRMEEYRGQMVLDPSLPVLDMTSDQLLMYLSERGVAVEKSEEVDHRLLLRKALHTQAKEMEMIEERMQSMYRDLVKQRNINNKLAKEKWQLQALVDSSGISSKLLDQRNFGNVKVLRPRSTDSQSETSDSQKVPSLPIEGLFNANNQSQQQTEMLSARSGSMSARSGSMSGRRLESGTTTPRSASVTLCSTVSTSDKLTDDVSPGRRPSLNSAVPLAARAATLGRRSVGRVPSRTMASDIFKDPPK